MGRPTALTKQTLLNLGITAITRDGHVYVGDREVKMNITCKKSRYGEKHYRTFGIYSKAIYEGNRKTDSKATNGSKTIVLSRAIWAWFNEICPADLDVDHINDDSLDDRLENYQLLTRSQNLAKRKGHMNQYEKSKR